MADPFNLKQLEQEREECYAANPGYAATLFGAGLQVIKGKAPTAIFTHAQPVADGTLDSPAAQKAQEYLKRHMAKN
jgi:hypothetical protein